MSERFVSSRPGVTEEALTAPGLFSREVSRRAAAEGAASETVALKSRGRPAVASTGLYRAGLVLISLIVVVAVANAAFDAGQTTLDFIVICSSLGLVCSVLWLAALGERRERKLMLHENARLVEELRASRGRIVATAQSERLRLERDLHDGAQQRLLAIQIKLGLACKRLGDGETAARLDEIAEDSAAAVEELRALAHGIYPTVLRERGLAEALYTLGCSTAPELKIDDRGVGRCPPAVEAAAYFCVLEAIQNATKHAGPDARVTITLERQGTEIELTVSDTGVGFRPDLDSSGTGLLSMRDRIASLGGELEIHSESGRGTRVRATVPLGSETYIADPSTATPEGTELTDKVNDDQTGLQEATQRALFPWARSVICGDRTTVFRRGPIVRSAVHRLALQERPEGPAP
jgi:signal transduction histidine kinase